MAIDEQISKAMLAEESVGMHDAVTTVAPWWDIETRTSSIEPSNSTLTVPDAELRFSRTS